MEGSKVYEELDEVRAPEDLPEVGVRAGDVGVVIAELRNPEADPLEAVEVEYADEDGVPRAYAIYTPDLSGLVSSRREF